MTSSLNLVFSPKCVFSNWSGQRCYEWPLKTIPFFSMFLLCYLIFLDKEHLIHIHYAKWWISLWHFHTHMACYDKIPSSRQLVGFIWLTVLSSGSQPVCVSQNLCDYNDPFIGTVYGHRKMQIFNYN